MNKKTWKKIICFMMAFALIASSVYFGGMKVFAGYSATHGEDELFTLDTILTSNEVDAKNVTLDFKVTDIGKSERVDDDPISTPQTTSVAVALVIDRSWSMDSNDQSKAISASNALIKDVLNLKDADGNVCAKVQVITYAKTVDSPIKDFSSDYNTVKINSLSSSDNMGTNTGAALEKAGANLSKTDAEKKIIVLLSDGCPNIYKKDNGTYSNPQNADYDEKSATYVKQVVSKLDKDIILITVPFIHNDDNGEKAENFLKSIASKNDKGEPLCVKADKNKLNDLVAALAIVYNQIEQYHFENFYHTSDKKLSFTLTENFRLADNNGGNDGAEDPFVTIPNKDHEFELKYNLVCVKTANQLAEAYGVSDGKIKVPAVTRTQIDYKFKGQEHAPLVVTETQYVYVSVNQWKVNFHVQVDDSTAESGYRQVDSNVTEYKFVTEDAFVCTTAYAGTVSSHNDKVNSFDDSDYCALTDNDIKYNAATKTYDVYYKLKAKHDVIVEYKYKDKDGKETEIKTSVKAQEGIKVGDKYNAVNAATIKGYTVVGSGTIAGGTMGDKDAVLTFYYTKNAHTLTIKYISSAAGSKVLYTEYSKQFEFGDTYSEDSPSIDGYTLKDKSQAVISGTMDDEDIEIEVVYDPLTYNLTINYFYENGNPVEGIDTYYGTVDVDAAYSVESPVSSAAVDLTHFKPDRGIVSGTMTAADKNGKVEKVTYIEDGKYPISFFCVVKEAGKDDITTSLGTISRYIGVDLTKADYPQDPIFTNIDDRANDPFKTTYTGSWQDPVTLSDGSVRVDYVVTKVVTPQNYTVTVVYNYEDGESVETDPVEVTYGDPYEIESPEAPEGYTADKDSVKIEKMPAEDLTFEVNYSKNTYGLVINYISYEGDEIVVVADPYVTTVKYGEDYERKSPEVEGYSVSDDFETVSGTMGVPENGERLEITVVYTRNSYLLTINYVDRNGNKVAGSHTENVEYKASYSVGSPDVNGYAIKDAEQKTITGIMPAKAQVITVTYKKLATLRFFEKAYDSEENSAYAVINYDDHTTAEQIQSPALPEVPGGYVWDGWKGYIIITSLDNVAGARSRANGSDDDFDQFLKYFTVGTAVSIDFYPTYELKTVEPAPPVETTYLLTIDYIFEGGAKAAESFKKEYKAGEAVTIPYEQKENYTVSISEVIETMPAEDKVITVTYKPTQAPPTQSPSFILPPWQPTTPTEAPTPEPAPIVEIEAPETPEGAPEEEPTPTPEEVELDIVETPEGAPEEEIEIDEIETPEGDLPQTGVASTGVFFGIGAACIAIGGLTIFGVRRKEEM